MNWFKERVGLQDPIYGPSACNSVASQTDSVPWSELSSDDLRWTAMDATSVETQTFYVTTESGHVAMAQVIYNSVANIRTTVQFSTKIFYPGNNPSPLWATDALSNWGFDKTKHSLHADNCALTLSEDGTSFHIKSSTSRKAIVDLKFKRTSPSFQAGSNGTTYYGTDPQKPWGSMLHRFWPRCEVEGSIITQGGELNMEGRGCFIHCLQGMRPNLAAATWNFINLQSPAYSAVMMEFTTPPSYGSTIVNVGCIAVDGKIIMGGARHMISHTSSKNDDETGWPEPQSAKFEWSGKNADGEVVQAEVAGQLGTRIDRIDVLNEVPKFVKVIIAQAAGTKPYIYQFRPNLPLKIKIGDKEETVEGGSVFMEATFITGTTS